MGPIRLSQEFDRLALGISKSAEARQTQDAIPAETDAFELPALHRLPGAQRANEIHQEEE